MSSHDLHLGERLTPAICDLCGETVEVSVRYHPVEPRRPLSYPPARPDSSTIWWVSSRWGVIIPESGYRAVVYLLQGGEFPCPRCEPGMLMFPQVDVCCDYLLEHPDLVPVEWEPLIGWLRWGSRVESAYDPMRLTWGILFARVVLQNARGRKDTRAIQLLYSILADRRDPSSDDRAMFKIAAPTVAQQLRKKPCPTRT